MAPAAGEVRVGISGWTYAPWRGVFFPEGLPRRRELPYAADRLRTIEINGTFYSLQRPHSFERWAAETPNDFVFSVKAPRYITHILRLRDVDAPLANFLASGLLRLGGKLGPILWQFPPNFSFDQARMEAFIRLLPGDTIAASAFARRHDSRMEGRAYLESDARRPLRHAIEIRHQSFVCPEFIEMLRRYSVALVCADAVAWPRLMDVTSDFVYCRLHGSQELYTSGYDDTALDAWAARVFAWAKGGEPADAERVLPASDDRSSRDVFIYFDNDAKVRAPFDALGLRARVEALLRQR
ncbi:MAG: DUF72 domain-containing protein [Rhodospirillales bacterium]|nr:DUF72 domain-containing protein [Rhodospirillales bacterium]